MNVEHRSPFKSTDSPTNMSDIDNPDKFMCHNLEKTSNQEIATSDYGGSGTNLPSENEVKLDKDVVLFHAQGELIVSSKACLLATRGTYFSGLLETEKWRRDETGAYSIDEDPAVLKLVIASLSDTPSFLTNISQLDCDARKLMEAKLDYYLIPVVKCPPIKTTPSILVQHDSIGNSGVTLSKTGFGWCGAIWDASIHKYSVIVKQSSMMLILIGFAPMKLFNPSKNNSTSCGWYILLRKGTLWAQNGVGDKTYSGAVMMGDTIACIYNDLSKEIYYEKNGVPLGLAYSNVVGDCVAPAVQLGTDGDSVFISAVLHDQID